MSNIISIPPDHPSLPGHFPGHPVVPGVIILQRVHQQLAQRHPELATTGVKKLKYLRLLQPGEAFCVNFAQVKNGGIRFTCVTSDTTETLAEGHLAITEQCTAAASTPGSKTARL